MQGPDRSSSESENRVRIPAVNWPTALAEAVRNAQPDTILVVDSEVKKGLVLRAAQRMGKQVNVEVEQQEK